MLTIDEIKVADVVLWDSGPAHIRIDRIDHNAEIVWGTFLDGKWAGNSGPLFLDDCSRFVIDEEVDVIS